MILEPKRGGTRGQADYSDPDAGGVALKAWRDNSDVQKWAAVRRRRRWRVVMLSVHGFTLRASPAVKHGVSPPGTVSEHVVSLGRTDTIRVWANSLIVFSNMIRGRTDTISARADRLIVSYNAIRIFMIIAIAFVRLCLQMIQRSIRSFTK